MNAAIEIHQSEPIGENELVTPQESVTLQVNTVIDVDSGVILDVDNNTVKSPTQSEKSHENCEQETKAESDENARLEEESCLINDDCTEPAQELEIEKTTHESEVSLDQQSAEQTELNINEHKEPACEVTKDVSQSSPTSNDLDIDAANMALAYASLILKDCEQPKTEDNFRNSFSSSRQTLFFKTYLSETLSKKTVFCIECLS